MLRKIGLIAALMVLPAAAFAQGVSYNYGELNYLYTDGEVNVGALSGSDSKSAFGLKGSFGFTDMLYGTATYEDKGYGGALDNYFNLGIGAHSNQFTGGFDLVGELTYEDLDDQDGFGLLVGLRGEVSPGLELNADVKYRKLSDLDGWDFTVGGVYTIAPNWGVSASYTHSKLEDGALEIEADDWRLGVRYMF